MVYESKIGSEIQNPNSGETKNIKMRINTPIEAKKPTIAPRPIIIRTIKIIVTATISQYCQPCPSRWCFDSLLVFSPESGADSSI